MRHQNQDLATIYLFSFYNLHLVKQQFIKSLSTPCFSCPRNTKYMYFTLFTKVQLLDPIISIEKDSIHIEYTTVSLSHCSSVKAISMQHRFDEFKYLCAQTPKVQPVALYQIW